MLIGCDKTFLSNLRSVISFTKNRHIAINRNGSVGKLMFKGAPGMNSDNSNERGVKKSNTSNSLSKASNARNAMARANGTNVITNDSL